MTSGNKHDWEHIDPILYALYPGRGGAYVSHTLWWMLGKKFSRKSVTSRCQRLGIKVNLDARAAIKLNNLKARIGINGLTLEESDAIILAHYSNNGANYCSELIGKSWVYVTGRANFLGIKLSEERLIELQLNRKTTRRKNKGKRVIHMDPFLAQKAPNCCLREPSDPVLWKIP